MSSAASDCSQFSCLHSCIQHTPLKQTNNVFILSRWDTVSRDQYGVSEVNSEGHVTSAFNGLLHSMLLYILWTTQHSLLFNVGPVAVLGLESWGAKGDYSSNPDDQSRSDRARPKAALGVGARGGRPFPSMGDRGGTPGIILFFFPIDEFGAV